MLIDTHPHSSASHPPKSSPIAHITPINRTDIAPFLTKVFVLAESSVLLFGLTKLVALTSDTDKRKSKHESQRREPRV